MDKKQVNYVMNEICKELRGYTLQQVKNILNIDALSDYRIIDFVKDVKKIKLNNISFYYTTFYNLLREIGFNFRSSFVEFDALRKYVEELSNEYETTFFAVYLQYDNENEIHGNIYVYHYFEFRKHYFSYLHSETTCNEQIDDIEEYDTF